MNNRGQNVNPNGAPQNHHPNQGYPKQNNQYQGNGYNGQNPQYNNQQYQGYNNNQNPQYRGQGYNAQSPQNNNMNNPQYRGQGYNGQNPQYNNMNNQQYRGQGNNGQNTQFGNPNNPQFNNQNVYNNPNQFNPQFGNNQNFNPMNRRPKMDSKMVGYITAAVAAILVVLMIFMFSSSSGKLGGATPEEAVKNVMSATKDCDFEKLVNNIYIESDEARTEARTKALEEWNNLTDNDKKEQVKKASEVKIGEVKSINENIAIVELKIGGDTEPTYVKKVNGRWFINLSGV